MQGFQEPGHAVADASADCSRVQDGGAKSTSQPAPAGGQNGAGSDFSQGGARQFSGQLPHRPGMTKCAFYLKTGECKFGEGCRYDHPPGEGGTDPTGGGRFVSGGRADREEGHQSGLPVRPGVQECAFFMKTGMCKYGSDCRWHHPPEKQADGGMAAMMKLGGGGGAGAMGMSNPLLANPLANPMALMGAMMGMGAMGGALGGGGGGMAAGLGMGGAGDWETHYNDAGRPYYFNSRTQVSQWDPPMEMVMQQTLGSMMGAAAAPSPGMTRGMSSGFSRGPASSQASIGSGGAHPVRKFPSLPPLVVPLSTQPTPYSAHLAHRNAVGKVAYRQ